MCGLVGILGPGSNFFSKDQLQCAEDLMSHRGPDSSGQAISDWYKLGHKRLAISGGLGNNQPIFSKNSNSVLIFNGQIYNAASLIEKFELAADKENDGEVFVELLEKLGTEAFKYLDGVFAGIHVNKVSQTATIFRDRFGARPLYFHQAKNHVVAASEINPIKLLAENASIREDALLELLTLNMPITEKTYLKDINRLEPGAYNLISLETGQIQERGEYFKYQRKNRETVVRKGLKAVIEESILSQIKTDELTTIYLSGGVDSSILAILAQKLSNKVNLMTLGFDNEEFSESENAENLAEKLNLPWTEIKLTPQLFKTSIQDTIESMQEPRIGQSCINFLIHKNAKITSRVSFSGAGADELFGGYPWRYPLNVTNGRVVPLHYSLEQTAEWISEKWNRVGGHSIIESILSIEAGSARKFALKRIEERINLFDVDWENEWAAVEACLQYERETFLQNLLSLDDALAMKSSLEVRVPFLSNGLVSYSESLHPSELFSYSVKQNKILGKMPLRKLLEDLGYGDIAYREKIGFGAPIDIWKTLLFEFMENTAASNLFLESLDELRILSDSLNNRDAQGLIWSLAAAGSIFKVN
jgi:asparagine synthase (glutamine-hydrolysing)